MINQNLYKIVLTIAQIGTNAWDVKCQIRVDVLYLWFQPVSR